MSSPFATAASADSESVLAGRRTFLSVTVRPPPRCSTGDFRSTSSIRSTNDAYSSAASAPVSVWPSPSQSTGAGIVASTVNGPLTRT